LGAGLGTLGPASGFGGRKSESHFNGESLPSFLVVELGIGSLLFLGFFLGVGVLVLARLRRIRDTRLRSLLAAFAAPFAGVVAGATVNANTTQTPIGAYVWFAAGILVYWLSMPILDQREAA
jgi:hypothetical protein